mgnify:CR=1 FL=1
MAKKKERKEPFFIGFLDIIDLAINFLPGKALTALILVGAVSGTIAYDAGIDSVEIPIIPECPVPEPCSECPVPEPCPTCKTLDDYTDEELIDALKPRYVCYQND